MSGPTPSLGSLSGQNIRICCRIRPVAIGVEEETSGTVVYQHSHKSLHLLDPRHKGVSREFAFDRVYCQEHTEEVFREEICDHIPGLFSGNHLTVFAHGASGSGKTFTMEGAEPPGDYGGLGITPQSVAMIFWHMEHQLSEAERELFEVKFSLYEIYCEKVRDLLQDVGGCNKDNLPVWGAGGESLPTKYDLADLPIQKDLSGFEIIPDLKEISISSVDEFWKLYQKRIKLRKKGRTLLNEESSRSHAFCVVKVVKKDAPVQNSNDKSEVGGTGNAANTNANVGIMQRKPSGVSSMTFHERPRPPQTGRLFLVDLAGCEDNRMSGNSGVRMLESQAINDTYLALVKVFHALKQKQKLSAFCRDAKLTRLLRAALESKKSPCLVLITVSPSRFRFQATLNTFQYLQLNGTPLQVQPNPGVEVPPLPLQNAGVRKIVFPENKRQFSARDNRSYSARLHPPGGTTTTTATTPPHGPSAGTLISGTIAPPPNKISSLRPSHSARRIRPPPSAPVQGRQKAGVNVRASAEDLRQLAARSAHVFAAAKNKSASAQSARPGNKSRSFAAASHQAFLADDINYKGTSTKDEVGLGNDEINSEDVLDELDEDWKNARSIEVEEYEAFNGGFRQSAASRRAEEPAAVGGGSDENDRRIDQGAADVRLTFADRVAKAESLRAEPGERGRAGSLGSGEQAKRKPEPGTGGKAEAMKGAAGSSSFPLPSSGEVEKQKLSGEKNFRGPSPSRGCKNSREPGERNSTETEKNGGGDQAQVGEDHDHPDNSKQMLPPIKSVGGEPETTEVESPVTTTPKNWSMANNFPSRPSSAGAPAAPSSPRVQKFLQERSPQLLARAAQLQQLQQEYVRPPPDVEPAGECDQPRPSPLPAPSSPSEGREGAMDPTSTSTSSRTSSRNHSSVGTSEAYSEDFNTNTSPDDQDSTTSSDHSKPKIDSERTTADSWQRSVEEVGRNLGQIAALRGEKRKVGAGEAAEVGAGQSTSSTNKGHGAQTVAAVGGGDVDEKANAATKTTTTKTTTTKTATSQETVRENRERLERGLTEQKPSKIGKPSMNAKAWSGMTKGNQPSQEILNGMRSCLRPPSNIRKVGGPKTSDDLSTTKIVRNYFPAQDKLEI